MRDCCRRNTLRKSVSLRRARPRTPRPPPPPTTFDLRLYPLRPTPSSTFESPTVQSDPSAFPSTSQPVGLPLSSGDPRNPIRQRSAPASLSPPADGPSVLASGPWHVPCEALGHAGRVSCDHRPGKRRVPSERSLDARAFRSCFGYSWSCRRPPLLSALDVRHAQHLVPPAPPAAVPPPPGAGRLVLRLGLCPPAAGLPPVSARPPSARFSPASTAATASGLDRHQPYILARAAATCPTTSSVSTERVPSAAAAAAIPATDRSSARPSSSTDVIPDADPGSDPSRVG